tara:strand:+ start:1665 stop:4175 length:2511 start_codon:yes stop_codon:yes gene_type:complete
VGLFRFLILIFSFLSFLASAEDPPSDLSDDAKILWDYIFAVPPKYYSESGLLKGTLHFPQKVKKEVVTHPEFIAKYEEADEVLQIKFQNGVNKAKQKVRALGFDPEPEVTIYRDFKQAEKDFAKKTKLKPHEIRNQAMSYLGLDPNLPDSALSPNDQRNLNQQMIKIEILNDKNQKTKKFNPQKWWEQYRKKNYARVLEERKKILLYLINKHKEHYPKDRFDRMVLLVKNETRSINEYLGWTRVLEDLGDIDDRFLLLQVLEEQRNFQVSQFSKLNLSHESRIRPTARRLYRAWGSKRFGDFGDFLVIQESKGDDYWEIRNEVAKKLKMPNIDDIVRKRFPDNFSAYKVHVSPIEPQQNIQRKKSFDQLGHVEKSKLEEKTILFEVKNGDKGFYVERSSDELSLTKKVKKFPKRKANQSITTVKSILPITIEDQWISIPTPPDGKIQDFRIYWKGRILSRGEFDIFEMKHSDGVLVQLKHAKSGASGISFQADFIKKPKRKKSLPKSLTRISSEKLKKEAQELKKAGFDLWASDLEELSSRSTTVSRDEIKRSFLDRSVYVNDAFDSPTENASGKYARWSGLNKGGSICVQCTSSNQINLALMNEILPKNVQMIGEHGLVNDGSGVLRLSDGHRRNVIRVKKLFGYIEFPDDSTPGSLRPFIEGVSSKEKDQKKNNQKLDNENTQIENNEQVQKEIKSMENEELKIENQRFEERKQLKKYEIQEAKRKHLSLMKKYPDVMKNQLEKEIYQLSVVVDGLLNESISLEEASKKISKIANKVIPQDKEYILRWIQERVESYGEKTRNKLSVTAQKILETLDHVSIYVIDSDQRLNCLLK